MPAGEPDIFNPNLPLDRLLAKKLRNGTRLISDVDGERYVVSNLHQGGLTLRREVPKLRGKRARHADRERRALARQKGARAATH